MVDRLRPPCQLISRMFVSRLIDQDEPRYLRRRAPRHIVSTMDDRRKSAPDRSLRPATRERFNALADQITASLGSLQALIASVVLVVVWALTGPIFNFSDTWQLFINTTTTVVTFWMVFVIQNSANRSSKATQLKLDEIIRVLGDARNDFIALDKATEDVLSEREREFDQLVNGDGHDAEATSLDRTHGRSTVGPSPGSASRR
jgi:low affinity Fe/Cu permease